MAVLYTPHFIQFFDEDGAPLAGGKLYTYAAGTTAPKATYTTAAGNIENTNPVVLDSEGRAVLFIDGSYKFLLTDANDVPVGPNGGVTDNVTSFIALDSGNDPFFESFSGNGSQTVFTMPEDLGTDERGIYVWVDNGIQEAVSNGDFATDTVWTKGAGWTIGAGVATATGAISTAISQTSVITLVQGRSYAVTFTITASAGSLTPSIGGTSGTARNSGGTYTEIIIAGATQAIAFTGAGFTGTLDNVSVKPTTGIGSQILPPTAYTINGTSLTLNTAPASGTGNILVAAPLLAVGAAASSAAAAQAAEASALIAQAAAELAETNAETAETNAEAAQALAEAAADRLTGTSTSSVTIGTGSKVFTTQADKFFEDGNWLLITSDADPSNYMHGQVTAYSGTSLTVNVTNIGGSGTLADWTIRLSGTRGAVGATGPAGSVADGDKGDITVSSSGSVWTIDNSAVTLAKIQDISTRKILGRTTAGTGVTEQLDFIDDDTMATATATNIPSAESVKAYVDANAGSVVVQRDYVENVTVVTCSIAIPIDDTIPQITEGTEILSKAFTMTSATNILRITTIAPFSGSSAINPCLAIFNGATNAIDAKYGDLRTSQAGAFLFSTIEIIPGVTTPVTYSVRVGGNGIGSTMYVNGKGTSRIFGGVSRATMVLEEITP